jgi:calcium-translocating P-type ATPase
MGPGLNPSRYEIVHSSFGRLRIHLSSWPVRRTEAMTAHLGRVGGVRRVEANAFTRNVLLVYEPQRVTPEALLRALPQAMNAACEEVAPVRPAPTQEDLRHDSIPVRGLDRDPHLGGRLVERLQKHGVQARVSLLTAQLHVAYDHTRVRLDDILKVVAGMVPPASSAEDNPRHPLDADPLRDGVARAVGSLAAVTVLTLQRLIAPNLVPTSVASGAGVVAGVFNLIQGFPVAREGLRRLLGRKHSDAITNTGAITALGTANLPLGLVVAGLEGFVLAEEVTARRAAWRRYEDNVDTSVSGLPGDVIRLEAGTRTPRDARVIEGFGTAINVEGQPHRIGPSEELSGGALLLGGPFILELMGGEPLAHEPRPVPRPTASYERYLRWGGSAAIAAAAFTGLRTLSFSRAFETMLLFNPRPAVMGVEAARLFAAGRALRAGITVTATRADHPLGLPDSLLLDGARLLTDGVEVDRVIPLQPGVDSARMLRLAAAVSEAAGAPWGSAFGGEHELANDGSFDGSTATACVNTIRYQLREVNGEGEAIRLGSRCGTQGVSLELRAEAGSEALGLITLRPRLAPTLQTLIEACRQHQVELAVLPGGDGVAAAELCRRAEVELLDGDGRAQIADRQRQGKIVAVVSDGAKAAVAFEACDLGIGLFRGHSGSFPARADFLAPDLHAVADLLEAGARAKLAVRDAIVLSTISQAIGAVLSFQTPLGLGGAVVAEYLTGLAALAASWYRLRGGDRPRSALGYLSDPQPERWGRRTIEEALRAFAATPEGLRQHDAVARRAPRLAPTNREELLVALRNQVRAPITALLTGGACITLVLGQPLNTALLGFTIGMNVAAGVWQERQVGTAAEALQRMGAAIARVLRDGSVQTIPAEDVVLGDVLVLTPGTRVAADARLLSASSLEVAEAALTGESVPVAKGPEAGSASRRIVLEGSDVVVGTGHAVVIAVGRHTRLGATAAALNFDPGEESPLGKRLGQVLRVGLPVSFAGGALVTAASALYGTAPLAQLFTLGVTTALSAIPEGLPLLAGVGQAAVSRRLAKQNVVVRRLAGIEALGRVSVVCSDKTGTLTEGRLSVALIAGIDREWTYPGELQPFAQAILAAGALASPPPDVSGGATHPTDAAVLRAAVEAGLAEAAQATRDAEVPFDSARAFHVSLIGGRFWVKGAPERILERCILARDVNGDVAIDEAARRCWAERAAALASRGLRVLMVASGAALGQANNPRGLTALGFIGICDPLRPRVPEAVQRCRTAGVRIIMLTGDHPATARTIAAEAGILADRGEVVTAAELTSLPDAELDLRLDRVAVIARAAPLDKLRFVESLRRRGHAVAMTGDGVNDAPSLRLADVGVAMGKGGTEVARQASDVVLADDNFASLVEALVEGRGFWRNMRTGLGLLIGGNAGELGMIVGASLLGYGSPLTAPQILMVNLITDTLPSLAILLQRPEHRDLASLSREGLTALDAGLRRAALHRGIATGVPSLAAYLMAHATGGAMQAGAVGFASVITTQLAQTLDAGRVQGFLSPTVMGAVAGSLGLLGTTYAIPPLRGAFNLTMPSLTGWAYVGGASAAAVALSRIIAASLPAPVAHEPGQENQGRGAP